MYETNDRALIQAARRLEWARPSIRRRLMIEREMRSLPAAATASSTRMALRWLRNGIVALVERRVARPDEGRGHGRQDAYLGVGRRTAPGRRAGGVSLVRPRLAAQKDTETTESAWSPTNRGGDGEVSVPTGVTVRSGEIYRARRSWVERDYHNLNLWSEIDKGGRFPAWEQPRLFSQEVQAAFRSVRSLTVR